MKTERKKTIITRTVLALFTLLLTSLPADGGSYEFEPAKPNGGIEAPKSP